MSNNKHKIICNIVKYHGGCKESIDCRGKFPHYGEPFGHDNQTCNWAKTEKGKLTHRFSVPVFNNIEIMEDGNYIEK